MPATTNSRSFKDIKKGDAIIAVRLINKKTGGLVPGAVISRHGSTWPLTAWRGPPTYFAIRVKSGCYWNQCNANTGHKKSPQWGLKLLLCKLFCLFYRYPYR